MSAVSERRHTCTGMALNILPRWNSLCPGVSVSVPDVDSVAAADIPASAIDFHVSDIVEELLRRPRVREAAAQASEAVAALGKHMDAAMCLRSAMWLFSSR